MRLVCYDADGNVIKRFTQWDTGQTIVVNDIDISLSPEFHFCNKKSAHALVVAPTTDEENNTATVDVPNCLLQEPYDIFIYIYFYHDYTIGRSKLATRIPMISRPMPCNYRYIENVGYLSALEYNKIYLELVEQVEETTQEMVDQVTETTNEMVEQVTNATNDMIEQVTETTKEMVDQVTTATNDMIEQVTEAVDNANTAADNANTAADNANQVADDITQKVDDAIKDAEEATDNANSAADNANQVADDITQKIDDVIKDAEEATEDANEAADRANKAAEAAEDVTNGNFGNVILSQESEPTEEINVLWFKVDKETNL